MNILILLAIVLGIMVLVRLANVAQLASHLAGENEEAEQDKDNRLNSWLLLGFLWGGLLLFVYMVFRYQPYMLPVSASEHGVEIDKLMNINWFVLITVFTLTQILLFTFAFKYRFNKNRRSFFYHDNHKLEAVWTIIPTIVLAALITTGLIEWNKITNAAEKIDGLVVQVYGKQFDWTARYAGKDNKLGASHFRKITDANPLGVDSTDAASADDIIARELYLPVGVPVDMFINSRDVLHSAYLPHFRVQMNAVPGMTTRFAFTPTITTKKMREITGNPNFDYVLLCNKICGVAHYNMKMKVVIVDPDSYVMWLNGEKKVFEKTEPAMPVAGNDTTAAVVAMNK